MIDNFHLVTAAAGCTLLMKYEDPNGNGINPSDLKVQMGTTFRYGTRAAEDDIKHLKISEIANIFRNRSTENNQNTANPKTFYNKNLKTSFI